MTPEQKQLHTDVVKLIDDQDIHSNGLLATAIIDLIMSSFKPGDVLLNGLVVVRAAVLDEIERELGEWEYDNAHGETSRVGETINRMKESAP